MTVTVWGWIFLGFYLVFVLYIALLGIRRTKTADDFATARNSYSGLVLGLAYMAMIASGSTFMGMPGLAYDQGFMGGYYPLLYPVGAYIGTMIIARQLKRVGDRFGSLSIPDFLGDIYRSPLFRGAAALLSLFLIYYLMSQLAASGQMFEIILNIPYEYGVVMAMLIILIYMIVGGSHSDIISDAIQGALMLLMAILVIGGFLFAFGIDGFGPSAVNEAIPAEMRWDQHANPEGDATFSSWWVIVLLLVVHVGFVSLPHLGNKFFAMRGTGQVRRFILTSSITGITVSFMFLGGILARANDIDGIHPDAALPALFVEMLPAWLAALLAMAILSAIVSTGDGVLMTLSQVFANDLYRKTWVPWRGGDPRDPKVDRRSLLIGRVFVVVAGVGAVVAVWTPPALLSIFMWVGLGGIIASLTGPLFLGVFWKRVNKVGALGGAGSAFVLYSVIHLGPQFDFYEGWFPWNENPFASGAVGMVTGFVLCWALSYLAPPQPEDHVRLIHRPETSLEQGGGGTADSRDEGIA